MKIQIKHPIYLKRINQNNDGPFVLQYQDQFGVRWSYYVNVDEYSIPYYENEKPGIKYANTYRDEHGLLTAKPEHVKIMKIRVYEKLKLNRRAGINTFTDEIVGYIWEKFDQMYIARGARDLELIERFPKTVKIHADGIQIHELNVQIIG